jgi:2-polyprenyl-3-methyl-5-hydroxy-6-metoxy-1,4-benzoquinol methylase
MNLTQLFSEGVVWMNENKLEQALGRFLELESNPDVSPLCHYFIARITNMIGEPEEAYELYYKAFEAMPNLTSKIFGQDHPNFNYVFPGKRAEKENKVCTLCGQEGVPRWTYSLADTGHLNPNFNPIRMWNYCEACHHMYAAEFPEKLFIHNTAPRQANPHYFSYYSAILANLRTTGYATGMTLFEVGLGAGECMLAAREIGYVPFGIDVIERHVEDAIHKYGLDAETADFIEFETDQKWDVLIMGDVIEHVSDPLAALKKAESLLTDDGAIWISTPSFESAYSLVASHDDPMRKQQFHLNYFSRESLYMILEQVGLVPVDYQISAHYNGSMEVVAIKSARF